MLDERVLTVRACSRRRTGLSFVHPLEVRMLPLPRKGGGPA